jgi:hypothetical protein
MAMVWWLSVFTTVLVVPSLIESYPLRPNGVTYFKTDVSAAVSTSFTCETCIEFFKIVRELFNSPGFVWDEIADIIADACVDFKIEDHAVCNGFVHLYKVSSI